MIQLKEIAGTGNEEAEELLDNARLTMLADAQLSDEQLPHATHTDEQGAVTLSTLNLTGDVEVKSVTNPDGLIDYTISDYRGNQDKKYTWSGVPEAPAGTRTVGQHDEWDPASKRVMGSEDYIDAYKAMSTIKSLKSYAELSETYKQSHAKRALSRLFFGVKP